LNTCLTESPLYLQRTALSCNGFHVQKLTVQGDVKPSQFFRLERTDITTREKKIKLITIIIINFYLKNNPMKKSFQMKIMFSLDSF